MKSFRKAIAIVIFVIIGFPLCMAGLSGISMKRWLQDGKPWKALVHDGRLDKILKSGEPAAFMPEQLTLSGTSLNGKAIASSILKVIDISLIATTADAAIDGMFSFASGKTDGKVPSFDLAPLKLELRGKSAPIAREYLALSGRESASDKEKKILTAELEKIALGIPDSLPMLPQEAEVSFVSKKIGTLNRNLTYLALAAAGILLACAFIGESSWKKRSIFLGTTMMVPSMIILIAGFLPYLVSPAGMVKSVMQTPLSSYPLTLEYTRYVLTTLSSGFRITGSVVVALAVLLMSARFLHTADEDSEA